MEKATTREGKQTKDVRFYNLDAINANWSIRERMRQLEAVWTSGTERSFRRKYIDNHLFKLYNTYRRKSM